MPLRLCVFASKLCVSEVKRPNNVNRLTAKFSRDIEYARKYLPEYEAHYMLWSPIVKARRKESQYDQVKHLEQVQANILNKCGVELELIINNEFAECLNKLRAEARRTTASLKSPVMRMLQIEEQLAKKVSSSKPE